MIKNYKIIGLCITKLNEENISNFAERLSVEAIAKGYRLFVFNSFRDFYNKDEYDAGAKSIYKAINFDILDALVIDDNCFYNKSIVDDVISSAKEKNIPVVVLNDKREGCFSITKDYRNTYKSLINHIIKDHGAHSLDFIAGQKGNSESEIRLQCYKNALAENGIPFDENRVFYGDYWNVPVYDAIDKIVARGLPDAIICVNDFSAVDACNRLKTYGIRVPEDIIVTGFDGIKSAAFYSPQISTCKEDIDGLARNCMTIIDKSITENCSPFDVIEEYTVHISESCGCMADNSKSFREQAAQLFHMLNTVKDHENALYSWADQVFECTDIGIIGKRLHDNILPGSMLCLNSNFLSSARRGEKTDPDSPFTQKMIVISAKDESYKNQSQDIFPLEELYPKMEEAIEQECMFVFQAIHVADKVCGYYAKKTDNISEEINKIHRLARIINIAFGTLVSHIEQDHMVSRMEDMQYRDTFTELLNMKGLIKRMKEIDSFARKRRIAVSVYCITRFKYISDTYGIQDTEEAISLVCESLQLANPSNSIVARISDDEFAVINLELPDVDMGEVITNAVAIFFNNIENYNDNELKDYFIEVSCGCTVAEPGWDNTIQTLLKIADGEMYLNRLKYGGESRVLKEQKTPKDAYMRFELLIEKNLFIYNFQPIIDAKTGEIYAYEALMRTTEEIGMNPGEILKIAKDYNRLYDIEKATISNVLTYMDNHFEKFVGKRVFINTIPGHFLTAEDYEYFSNRYSHLLKCCVIEITEQNDLSDDELTRIKSFGGNEHGCQLAVDDYGAGYSNIINLLRYKPQIIKIDRYLISDIQNDINKQMFVMSTIDFAQMNGIKTVAEGVETLEELKSVIEYGVDLIQGFYTAKPSPDPLQELPDKIKYEIISARMTD